MASSLKALPSPLYSSLNKPPYLVASFSLLPPKLRDSNLSQFRLKPTKTAPVCPIIRAQSSPDYLPDVKFYKVEAFLRPWRVPQVAEALSKMGIFGISVSDVRGFGHQRGDTKERQGGSEYSEAKFLDKGKMEIVVSKDQVEAVIDKIVEHARTGEFGDGKIFLVPIVDVVRVRTYERGEKAERMIGGLSDMSNISSNSNSRSPPA